MGRTTSGKIDVELDFKADWNASPGKVLRDTRSPDTGRWDPLDLVNGMTWSPTHTHSIEATGDSWCHVTLTWEGVAYWVQDLETAYMNQRIWHRDEAGAINKDTHEDMERVDSKRIFGFPRATTTPSWRHKVSGAGHTMTAIKWLAAGDRWHHHLAYSAEIDKDAYPADGQLSPLIRTFRPMTVTHILSPVF